MRAALSVGFPPVARADARLLILGSLPGPESLRVSQYYAYRFNRFWWIMGEIAGASPDLPYPERLERLMDRGIALWDTCHAAERPGALDQRIVHSTVVPNDFVGFFDAHPAVRAIFCNGQKSAQLYRRLVLPALPQPLAAIPPTCLPSTSPAHAGMPASEKLKIWRASLSPHVK